MKVSAGFVSSAKMKKIQFILNKKIKKKTKKIDFSIDSFFCLMYIIKAFSNE